MRAASRARLRGEALVDDALGVLRVVFEIVLQRLGDYALDLRADFGVAQPRLGLPLELRLGELDADDRRQAFAHVLAGEVGLVFLDEVLLAPVVVDDARQGAAEAGDVRTAVYGVDAVGE